MGAQDVANTGAWAAGAAKRQRTSPSSSESDSSICLEESTRPSPLYHEFVSHTPPTSGQPRSTVFARPTSRDPSFTAIGVGNILPNIAAQQTTSARPLKRYLDEEEHGYKKLGLPHSGSYNSTVPKPLCLDTANLTKTQTTDHPPLSHSLGKTPIASHETTKEDPEDGDLKSSKHSPDFYMISVASEHDVETSAAVEEPSKATQHWRMHRRTERHYIPGICDDPENSCNLSPHPRGRQQRQCRSIRARKPSARTD